MDLAKGKAGPRFAPMILAGGSGTRFWPRSRRAHAKQVLALDGERTMIQQTLERLLPLAATEDVWVFTNKLLSAVIAEQLPQVARDKILAEPVARNTEPLLSQSALHRADRARHSTGRDGLPLPGTTGSGSRSLEICL